MRQSEGRKDLEGAKGVGAHFEVSGGGGGGDIAKPDIIGENIPPKAADSPKLRAGSQIDDDDERALVSPFLSTFPPH